MRVAVPEDLVSVMSLLNHVVQPCGSYNARRGSCQAFRIPNTGKSCTEGMCVRIFTRYLCRRRSRLCAIYVLSTTLSLEAHGTVYSSDDSGTSVIPITWPAREERCDLVRMK